MPSKKHILQRLGDLKRQMEKLEEDINEHYSLNEEECPKDEEYLNKEFPKGETKFRGQAMVLLSLARRQGEKGLIEQWKSNISDSFYSGKAEGKREGRIERDKEILEKIDKMGKYIIGESEFKVYTVSVNDLKSEIKGEKK